MGQKENNSIPFRYDTKAINQDVPIRDVIRQYTGEEADAHGKIRCPSPSHDDKKPSAYIYDTHPQNQCHCFSCGETYKPIDIVMKNTNCSFGDACKMLIRDFGLPLSHYSNIDQIEAEQAKARLAKEQNGFFETFPLTPDDCKFLGIPEAYSQLIPNPNYDKEVKYNPNCPKNLKILSLAEMWENDKEGTEEMLLGICYQRKDTVRNTIDAEKKSFFNIYALHTKSEWNEAQKLLEAKERLNIGLFSNITMTAKQRRYITDIEDLQTTADRIAVYEDRYMTYDNVAKKIITQQEERKRALADKPKTTQQGRD